MVSFQSRYDHYIGGEYVPPATGQYFENPTPVTGQAFTEIARGTAADIDRALDAAHGAAPAWGRTSVAERAVILNQIADRMQANLEVLAVADSWDNGKPVRETLAADIPLAIDHFRYFAGAIRAQEGGISDIGDGLVAYHYHEPLGVVGQIIPWNFPILMAVWKLAPALAAGNAVVLKPAEQTPASIHVLLSIIGDLLPPGVLNVVNGFGVEAGKPSGGCCDGSSPMCYPAGEFRTGGSDVLLDDLHIEGFPEPVPVWMSVSQFEYWRHTHLTIDIVPGRGSGFSLEAPEGVRFLIRS
ncbi:MAG: aldehyde dehydrogenase family protein, partial [Pseudonocardiaceae bacterium]